MIDDSEVLDILLSAEIGDKVDELKSLFETAAKSIREVLRRRFDDFDNFGNSKIASQALRIDREFEGGKFKSIYNFLDNACSFTINPLEKNPRDRTKLLWDSERKKEAIKKIFGFVLPKMQLDRFENESPEDWRTRIKREAVKESIDIWNKAEAAGVKCGVTKRLLDDLLNDSVIGINPLLQMMQVSRSKHDKKDNRIVRYFTCPSDGRSYTEAEQCEFYKMPKTLYEEWYKI